MAINKINFDGAEIEIPTEYLKSINVDTGSNVVTILTSNNKKIKFTVLTIEVEEGA